MLQPALLALLGVFAAGCFFPVKRSAQCQEQIDACLKTCQRVDAPGPPPGLVQQGWGSTNTQSTCQDSCNSVCKD